MEQAKVYSYRRFSDMAQQKGASVARQDAFAQSWADKHGIELDAELSMLDEGLSAFHQKHVSKGALGVFLRAIEHGRIASGSILIVESLDRLSRAEVLDALAQLTLIINAGISVVTASDEKVYSRDSLKANPMDLLQSLLIMWRAYEESATKSKRVKDAIRRQCLGWQAGTYRGLIRYGNTPSWLRVVDGKWELHEERAAVTRTAISMYLQGLGTSHICTHLHQQGLKMSGQAPHTGFLRRLLLNPALRGDKVMEVDGEQFELRGYYPALVDEATWQELQQAMTARARPGCGVRGDIPSILTGGGLTVCGYCGASMKAQTMASKRRPDGTLADGHRRLQCLKKGYLDGCAIGGSCSAAPVERAIIRYCSDMVNLRSLYRGDSSAAPRAELASATAELAKVDRQLERLTDALLDAEGGAPATFIKRGRELEEQRAQLQRRVAEAEQQLAQVARADLDGADDRWRTIAEGVDALDYAARTQARKLIVDTFERIVVWHSGLRPDKAPKGTIDIMFKARGGDSRTLRIDASGGWVAGELSTL